MLVFWMTEAGRFPVRNFLPLWWVGSICQKVLRMGRGIFFNWKREITYFFQNWVSRKFFYVQIWVIHRRKAQDLNALSQVHPNFQCCVPKVVTWALTMFTCHCSCTPESKRVEGTTIRQICRSICSWPPDDEEQINPLEMADLAERRRTNPKVLGSYPTLFEVFRLRLLAPAWCKILPIDIKLCLT